jgi:two-component system cell cycle sensor histidine kinase/response regulator CckA
MPVSDYLPEAPGMSSQPHEAVAELARLARELERQSKSRREAETIAEQHLRRLYDHQKELEKSESRFHLLFSANPVPVWVHDAQTLAFLEVNDAAVAKYGYTRGEFLRMRITEILVPGHGGSMPEGPGALQPHLLKNGNVISAEVASHSFEYEGRPAVLVVAHDVTERQRTHEALEAREQYFRHLIENAMDLITILNGDGTIRFESPSMEKVLGYKPEDYLGKNAFDFVHPEDLARVTQAFLEALQTPGETPPLTFRVRHKDGSWHILEGVGNNLLSDPVMAGIVFNSRDITDRKRLEERYLQSQKVQAIGQLAGGVAHDFNNILTAIIGYSDMILRQVPPGGPLRGHLEEIRKAADRASSLTHQLLAFSRQQVLQPRIFDLNASITDMHKLLRRLLGESINLVTLPHQDLGSVRADPGQIEQVLLNLAVNARDAMPGGGVLTIETANVTLDQEYACIHPDVVTGDYVLLAVSDTGAGIPPDIIPRIFEPFFTTKGQGKGTGLGLATCHGIIKQSGGHIGVYSEIGHGTTFKVYLPRVAAAPEVAPRRELLVPLSSMAKGKETVLVVEDEATLLDLAIIVLSDLGYRVLAADNGVEALRVLEQCADEKIDVLITDVVMPQMGGKELADRVSALYPDIRIIFCSGYTQDAIVHGSVLERGATFVQKPYTAEILASRIREVLER